MPSPERARAMTPGCLPSKMTTFRPGTVWQSASIDSTLAAIPPVTSVCAEPPSASWYSLSVAGVMRGTRLPCASSTPSYCPASRMRAGLRARARASNTSSVLTIVPPCTSSTATSPYTSGTSPCCNACSTGASSMRMIWPPRHTAEAEGCTRNTGTPVAWKASSTIGFSRAATTETSAKPRHSSGVETPRRVPYVAAAVCPKLPLPCPRTRRSAGLASSAVRTSAASRLMTSVSAVSVADLSVMSEPPSFRNVSMVEPPPGLRDGGLDHARGARLAQRLRDPVCVGGADQRDHIAAAASAGELCPECPGSQRRVDQPLQLRRGHLQAAQQVLVLHHERAEAGRLAALDGGARLPHKPANLLEDGLVTRRFALPARPHRADCLPRGAWPAGVPDEQVEGGRRSKDFRLVPAHEIDRLPVAHDGVIHAAWRAVIQFLNLVDERG